VKCRLQSSNKMRWFTEKHIWVAQNFRGYNICGISHRMFLWAPQKGRVLMQRVCCRVVTGNTAVLRPRGRNDDHWPDIAPAARVRQGLSKLAGASGTACSSVRTGLPLLLAVEPTGCPSLIHYRLAGRGLMEIVETSA
jgi:hypothetical protein